MLNKMNRYDPVPAKNEFSEPLLTVVTVTRNDISGVLMTLESLKEIKDSQLEVVIVDGSESSYDFDSVIKSALNFSELQIIRNSDKGIYQAMNDGLAVARGNYVWFLNGGDTSLLKDIKFLEPFFRSENNPILFCDYKVRTERFSVKRKAKNLSKINHALPTSHQAIFYPKQAFLNIGFNPNYKICADYASIAELYVAGIPFTYINQDVAEFNLNGISGKNGGILRREAKHIQREILQLGRQKIFISSLRHRLTSVFRRISEIVGGSRS